MEDKQYERLRQRRRMTIDGFVGGGSTPAHGSHAYLRPQARRAVVRPERPVVAPRPVVRTASIVPPAPPKTAFVRIDMSLPGTLESSFKKPVIRRRLSVFRHWAFKTAVVTMALFMAGGGLLFTQGIFSAKRVFKGGAQAAALQANVDPNLLKGEGDGRVNVALLGIGGRGHDGADLTDTIIIASIDPVNKTADLLSVPRDLWVKVPGHGSMKINAAYATGKYGYLGKIDSSSTDTQAVQAGFKMLDTTLESVLGIDVHYNVLLNFQAFRQAIDTVGGVSITVPEALYDKSMAWENGNSALLAPAGQQVFDGKKALLYVRSRHTSSDFARSERQRAVLMALKEKVVTLGTLSNPLKLSQLMGAFGSNVVTDLSIDDAGRLYGITKEISESKIKSLGLSDEADPLVTTGRVGNQSVVLPKAGMYQYDAIQTFVRSSLPDGYLIKEAAVVTVLNGTTDEGLAEAKAADLKTYGYKIGTVGDAPTKTYQKTVVVDLTHGKDKYTKHYLEQRFGHKVTEVIPDKAVQKGAADFIIILGTNETTRS